MSANRKVIITCAVTGSIHTPSMSPHLPITPREIADAAVGAAEAGAAIVHLHARDPVDGHPTQDPKYFREFAADIARRSDVVINFTTGGAATMTIEERLQPALQLKPEVASLNMGSMNFGLYPMLKRFPTFKFDWERPYLAGVGRAHLQEHVQGHRVHPDVVRRQRHAVRDRVLRHRASVHGGALLRARRREAAALHPERVRDPGRHRPASRRRRAHEAHRRPAVRRPVPVERARRRAQPAADRVDVGGDGRQRARRARGQPVARAGQARRIERRAGARGARRSSKAMGLEVATPDDARRILALKGRGKVAF